MRVQRRFDRYLLGLSLVAILRPARADEMLYRFDGTVHPRDDGWLVGECLPPVCTESFEEGHFVLRFDGATLSAQYYRLIAFSSDPPLPSLWVEWRSTRLGRRTWTPGSMVNFRLTIAPTAFPT